MANRISVDVARKILHAFFEGEWHYVNNNLGENVIIINGEQIRLFLVGQSISYEIESERGHLFSKRKGYPKMREVQPKDIIISCHAGMIKSINIALESAEETYGAVDGLRIDCYYNELDYPFDITPLRSRLAGYEPFGLKGNLPMKGYIHRLHSHAAKIMRDEVVKLGNRVK